VLGLAAGLEFIKLDTQAGEVSTRKPFLLPRFVHTFSPEGAGVTDELVEPGMLKCNGQGHGESFLVG
jgi:hypothetical protein